MSCGRLLELENYGSGRFCKRITTPPCRSCCGIIRKRMMPVLLPGLQPTAREPQALVSV
jgi:hypothetical protein